MPPIPGFPKPNTPPDEAATTADPGKDARDEYIVELERQLAEAQAQADEARAGAPDVDDASHVDDDPDAARHAAAGLSAGQVATYTYVDAYSGDGQDEATVHALVLAVDSDTGLATVALFPQVSELPADQLDT